MAKYLLQRLKDMHCIEDGEWDDLKLSSNTKSNDFIELIDNRNYKEVDKSK